MADDDSECAHEYAQGASNVVREMQNGAADEVRIARVDVAETLLSAFATCDGVKDLAVEFANAFLHGSFAQGDLAQIMPRTQVEVMSLAQLGNPCSALLLEIFAVPARHFDEVNRCDSFESVQVANFIFDVFDKLPLAILALEIRRRKTHEQQARFSEPLKDALPPV